MEAEEFKFSKPGEVRVRIAPSPTGLLHIGTARTALFNYLFARKREGSFVLRIEDTDEERSRGEYEEDIKEGLRWLGLEWDEGPDKGGPFAPYRQSKRKEIYAHYIKRLLEEDKAYYCFCTPEELEAHRQYLLSIGQPPKYSGKCAHLPKEKVKEYLKEGKPSVIRFRIVPKKVFFTDLIRGKVEFDASLFGDIIIAKDIYHPLYNLACVIDDFEMKITHVIRGEDHISNTPKQILLQEALGFPHPQYAHLPLILNKDRRKLSKRENVVSVRDYRETGYLPETLVNFMAFLGWNPGNEREIYSLNSLVKEFSLERVQKGGAVFNLRKLDFLNGFYIRQKSSKAITQLSIPYLIKANLIKPVLKEGGGEGEYQGVETEEKFSFSQLEKIITLYQGRLKKLSEIGELVDFFFKKELSYPKDLLRWDRAEDKEIIRALDLAMRTLSKLSKEEFQKENLMRILMERGEELARELGKDNDRGYLLWPLRVALTGKKASAGPFEIGEILGKEKVLERLERAKKIAKEKQ